jgi:hypothetical protein
MGEMVMFFLTIGRWRSMDMMWFEHFSARGSGVPGSFDDRVIVTDRDFPLTMSMGDLVFMRGDFLGAMLMFMTTMPFFDVTVPVANTVFITYPSSDPDYPGVGPGVPTLSQWGALVLAILLLFLYFLATRRRVETGRS